MLQNAYGNRGDDVQALKLCELQPYQMKHPNKQQTIFVVLGLQSEDKAGIRNMQTVCPQLCGATRKWRI